MLYWLQVCSKFCNVETLDGYGKGSCMASKKKIRVMTRLAVMEQYKGKELRQAKACYRNEYIGVRMLKNALRITFAFALGFLLWVCYNLESVMKKLNTLDIRGMVTGICAAYLFCMVSGLVITYIMATKRYFQGQKELQRYHMMLKHLEPEEDIRRAE